MPFPFPPHAAAAATTHRNCSRLQVEQCPFERYQRTHAVSAAEAAPAAVASAAAAEAQAEAEAEARAAEREVAGGGGVFSPLPDPKATGGGPEDGGAGGEGGGGLPAEVLAPAAAPPPVPSYTRLFSKNEDVDRLNVEELGKLQGEHLVVVMGIYAVGCWCHRTCCLRCWVLMVLGASSMVGYCCHSGCFSSSPLQCKYHTVPGAAPCRLPQKCFDP